MFDILIYGLMYGVIEAREKKDFCIPYLKDDKLPNNLAQMPILREKVHINRLFSIELNKNL